MFTPASEILQDLASALSGSGRFSMVTVGPSPQATAVPRAAVMFEGLDFSPADDQPSASYVRLRARVVVHTRAEGPSQAASCGTDISAAAANALLEDPWRGGRCQNLPTGRATEVGRLETSPPRGNEVELALALRCHFVSQEGET
jgi:hypothetical protein